LIVIRSVGRTTSLSKATLKAAHKCLDPSSTLWTVLHAKFPPRVFTSLSTFLRPSIRLSSSPKCLDPPSYNLESAHATPPGNVHPSPAGVLNFLGTLLDDTRYFIFFAHPGRHTLAIVYQPGQPSTTSPYTRTTNQTRRSDTNVEGVCNYWGIFTCITLRLCRVCTSRDFRQRTRPRPDQLSPTRHSYLQSTWNEGSFF